MKVLFVCTANTCRSPMLEYMFNAYLRAKGTTDAEVESAGLVLSNDYMNPLSLSTLDRHGVPYFDKHATFCTKQLYKKADYVFAMTSVHAEILRANYGAKRNLFALDELLGTDVPDPFGKGSPHTNTCIVCFGTDLTKSIAQYAKQTLKRLFFEYKTAFAFARYFSYLSLSTSKLSLRSCLNTLICTSSSSMILSSSIFTLSVERLRMVRS